ncbi:subtilisin-like protein [Russula earlei]|uniref:Subtilisin-like protein n=1 Tax=Russula earlei TaxID=71964 RepID=A0ACC0U412_9AGAM|nr:subtilisin-like protein [Russula earlei]
MYSLSVLSVLAMLAAAGPFGLASPTAPRWEDMSAKHSWASLPDKWAHHGPPPDGTTIDLRVALKPHRETALIDALYEVSDPEHPKYGAHLSKEQVAELVAPHPDTLELVGSWLAHHRVPSSSLSITHGGGWLTLSRVPVVQANALLGASYQFYRHTETKEIVLRTMGYALPAALHRHVDTVAPTTYFGSPRALRQTSRLVPDGPTLPQGDLELQTASATSQRVPPSCNDVITPTCLRLLYKTASYVPRAVATNKLGIAGYLEEYASQSDLTKFATLFRVDALDARFSVVTVNGGINNQSDPGVEANLDIQYADSISYPTPNVYYSTGGSPPFKPDDQTPTNTNEPYLDWLGFILDQSTTVPQTISTSYGDDEQTVPRDYATSVCHLFARLGAMGVSVLFSSGDFGVGGGSCHTNDGTNRVRFVPAFPASCGFFFCCFFFLFFDKKCSRLTRWWLQGPFVTAVGGTFRVNPEVAASFSGGGFSNHFTRPDFQNVAVSAYLRGIDSKHHGLYNTSGRGYPDISAQSMNFQVVLAGTVINTAGTSCSAPTAAGVFSLLNDLLISRGKPPLGFLNPLIYSKAWTGFNDITSGSNPGCGTSGFSAVKGWDPVRNYVFRPCCYPAGVLMFSTQVTGFGTPDFTKLRDLCT